MSCGAGDGVCWRVDRCARAALGAIPLPDVRDAAPVRGRLILRAAGACRDEEVAMLNILVLVFLVLAVLMACGIFVLVLLTMFAPFAWRWLYVPLDWQHMAGPVALMVGLFVLAAVLEVVRATRRE